MSEMMEMKTADLIGPALDWATFCAVYSGIQPTIHVIESGTFEMPGLIKPMTFPRAVSLSYSGAYGVECRWNPSGDWEHGGPLIARHQVNLHSPQNSDDVWAAWVTIRGKDFAQGGYQPLVAACRAIVNAKLGDTVSVPAELIKL